MRVFLINLEKNKERLIYMQTQLKRLGIDYERINAIYGKKMPLGCKRAAVNSFRWHCAIGRSIRESEIGCALSHFTIYEKMISEDIDVACIMEDDVVLGDEASRVLTEIETRIDVLKPAVYLLSDHSCDSQNGIMKLCDLNASIGNPISFLQSNHDWGAECYCITKKAASNILRWNYPLRVPCDHWGRYLRENLIDLYWVKPTIATQDKEGFVSDIMPSYFKKQRKTALRKLLHFPIRAIEKVLDKIL